MELFCIHKYTFGRGRELMLSHESSEITHSFPDRCKCKVILDKYISTAFQDVVAIYKAHEHKQVWWRSIDHRNLLRVYVVSQKCEFGTVQGVYLALSKDYQEFTPTRQRIQRKRKLCATTV